MKPLIKVFGLACVALTIGVASPAAAEEIVPPGNSAVTQYTEAYPTAGGEKDALKGKDKGKESSPKKVLGQNNVKKLEQHGETGEDVAELAAETTPAPVETSPETTAPPEPREQSSGGGGGNGGGGGDGNGAARAAQKQPKTESVSVEGVSVISVEQPSGSSGVGQVASQALGAPTSGHLGLLLPLALIGAIVWALLYRRRSDQEG